MCSDVFVFVFAGGWVGDRLAFFCIEGSQTLIGRLFASPTGSALNPEQRNAKCPIVSKAPDAQSPKPPKAMRVTIQYFAVTLVHVSCTVFY